MGSRSNRILLWLLAAALQAQSAPDFNAAMLNLQLLSDEDAAILESLLDNPLSLNTATPADLWFLDDSLAAALLAARRTGPFKDWEDMAWRTRLPPAHLEALRPFVYLPPDRGVQANLSTRLVGTGADERIRTRLNLDGGRWTAQWVLQRDPGEYRLTDLSDLSVTVKRGPARLALGAHRLTWGLGLVLADEFASPRGETLLRPKSRLLHLRPGYSNTNTGVLRGASIQRQWGRFQLAAGASIQQADIAADPDGTPRVVAYRTHTKPATTARETLGYLAGTVSLLGWSMGGLTTRYGLQDTPQTPGAQGRFYSLAVMRAFAGQTGEWSINHEEALQLGVDSQAGPVPGRAGQTRLSFVGLRGTQNDRLRLTLLYRRYPPGWTPLRGRLVGDRVSRGNESGWFFGWQWGRSPWKLGGYLDSFRQLQPQSAGAWPREGWESGLTLGARRQPVEASLFYRRREETAGEISPGRGGLDVLQQQATSSHYIRVALGYARSPTLTTRLMAAATSSAGGDKPGRGETLGARVRYRFRSGASLAVGAHGFATTGWEHRLYVYEDGLPGEFNFRALSGSGVRLNARLSLPVGKGLISLRVARQWRRADPGAAAPQESRQLGLQMDIAL